MEEDSVLASLRVVWNAKALPVCARVTLIQDVDIGSTEEDQVDGHGLMLIFIYEQSAVTENDIPALLDVESSTYFEELAFHNDLRVWWLEPLLNLVLLGREAHRHARMAFLSSTMISLSFYTNRLENTIVLLCFTLLLIDKAILNNMNHIWIRRDNLAPLLIEREVKVALRLGAVPFCADLHRSLHLAIINWAPSLMI